MYAYKVPAVPSKTPGGPFWVYSRFRQGCFLLYTETL